MNEQELTRRLSNAADIAPTATSPFDMTMSNGQPSRPRALLVAPALAGLLIAAGIGFVAGRNTSGFNAASAPATTEVGATTVPATVGASTSPPVSAPDATAPSAGEDFTIDVVDPEYATTGDAPVFDDDFRPVLERTVGDIRVRLSETPPNVVIYDVDASEAAPTGAEEAAGVYFFPGTIDTEEVCRSTVLSRITIDGPNVVDTTNTNRPAGLVDEPAYSVYPMGIADNSPVLVVDVVAADSVSVSATAQESVGGSTDTTESADGRAVLVIPVAPDTPIDDGMYSPNVVDVTVTMADGSTVAARGVAEIEAERCQPSALPDAGAPPADPDAAFAEVGASLQRLMDPTISIETKSDLLNDWDGVSDAVDAAQTGDLADAVASAEIRVLDHVFTSPTEVWFRYSIHSSAGDAGGLYGVANLVEGTWQFRREMMCQNLSLAGAECEPAAGPIGPSPYSYTLTFEN